MRAFLDDETAPHEAVACVSRALCRQGAHGRFVTRFLSVLDAGGTVVGVFDDAEYTSGHVSVAPGDRLLLFTDGLVEAGSSASHEYGDAHLVDTLVRYRSLGAANLLDRVFRDVHQWAGRLDDDATAVALAIDARTED